MASTTTLEMTRRSEYLAAASFTFFLYDYCLTFDREVQYFWARGRQNLNATGLLYVSARYFAVLAVFVSFGLFKDISHRDNPYEELHTLMLIVHWLGFLTIFASEGILILRTYALWWCKKRVVVLLGGILLACIFALLPRLKLNLTLKTLAAIYSFIFSTSRTDEDYHFAYVASYAGILTFETVVLIATVTRRLMHRGMAISPLMSLLYRDGIGYFMCILVISLVNLITTASNKQIPTQVNLQYLSHSIFSTRIILHIRAMNERNPDETVIEMTTIRFPNVTESGMQSEVEVVHVYEPWVRVRMPGPV